jgi:hypothetical protein
LPDRASKRNKDECYRGASESGLDKRRSGDRGQRDQNKYTPLQKNVFHKA